MRLINHTEGECCTDSILSESPTVGGAAWRVSQGQSHVEREQFLLSLSLCLCLPHPRLCFPPHVALSRHLSNSIWQALFFLVAFQMGIGWHSLPVKAETELSKHTVEFRLLEDILCWWRAERLVTPYSLLSIQALPENTGTADLLFRRPWSFYWIWNNFFFSSSPVLTTSAEVLIIRDSFLQFLYDMKQSKISTVWK